MVEGSLREALKRKGASGDRGLRKLHPFYEAHPNRYTGGIYIDGNVRMPMDLRVEGAVTADGGLKASGLDLVGEIRSLRAEVEGEFISALGGSNVPILELLPCATDTAFEMPLPTSSPGAGPSVASPDAAIRQCLDESFARMSAWSLREVDYCIRVQCSPASIGEPASLRDLAVLLGMEGAVSSRSIIGR